MSLPNEIDQDVACPDCGEAFAILDDGAGRCENGNCVSAHEWRSRNHVAALRNQRKPGHTEIPDVELERLREAVDRLYRDVDGENGSIVRAARAVFAHIPAKVDTKRDLRTIRDLIGSVEDLPQTIHDQLSAKWRAADEAMGRIEAAIEAMERKP